jgi:hypothetical protein
MKKISILLIAVVASIASYAQNVNTSPDNKKAILEEFTGQTCQFCPDGHKIGNDLAKANDGKIFLINIHSGGYAAPSTTYPLDLRTTVGTAIDGASGITGYPAGSVNRVKSPWASNRGAWASEAAAILAAPSPVNVWCKSSVDKDTRVLTTEVEIYYTANGTGTSNKLTVAVLQDGILGDQVGGTTYNPTNYVNGKYVHNHVLRMHQTPTSWGASLDTLTAGKLYKRTYYTVLPANVGNVPLDIYKLKVVAFVAEANNKILSGYEVDVTHNNPNIVDLILKDTSVLPIQGFLEPETKWCENKVTPRAKVTNSSSATITSFTMTATVNGVATPKTFTGSLAPGASTVVDWGQMNVAAEGLFGFKIEGFTNINGGTTLTDNKPENNTYSRTLIGIKPNAFATITEGFDGTSVKNLFIDNSEIPTASVMNYANSSGVPQNTGAEGTLKTLRIPLFASAPYSASNQSVHIVMGEADLRTVINPTLSYFYAYSDGVQSGGAPSVVTSYSTDCGTTWTVLNTTTCVSTGTAASGYFYVPVSSDYKPVTIDLNSIKGKSVLLRISGKASNDGNTLYLDQISLKNSGGGSGGGGTAAVDTFQLKVFKVTTATKTAEDVVGGVSMTKDSMYTWKITNVNMPTGWTFLTICDAENCVNYPGVQRSTFKAKGNPTLDVYKITIDHAKKVGYGSVSLKAWRGKDSTSTTLAKDLKFSMLTSSSSSISVVSDLNDKLLYYFDNKVFVDREFAGTDLEVFDIKGQMVLNTKVNSDNVDFTPLTGGIYIARISRDGEILKSHKFTAAK